MDDDFSSVMADPATLKQLMEAGFKFQPSPEELICKYLVPKTRGDIMKGVPMADVNLCEHEPWDLPDKSIVKLADQAWYFFCPRDLKYKNSKLSNRKTKAGHWKLTCKNKPIMAERTKKKIGVMKTLRFYKTSQPKDVTGWKIYELDLITNSSLSKKGQYVLCRLEYNSKDEKTKKGEQSHLIASVSHSEVEPSQSMASYSENKNPSEMAVKSPCDESELSHHVGSNFGNQNSCELMNNSASQLSELSHHMAYEFRKQNSNNLMSNLAYDGSGSSHSTVFNPENQYWNQPTVDSVYNGSESPYMAFDSENQNPNELLTVDSAYIVSKNHCMAFDSENQNPNVLLTVDSASNVSESHYMAFDLGNQNLNNSISLSTCENSLTASRGLENQESPFPPEGESGTSMVMPCSFINQSIHDKSEPSSLMDFDFENQNPGKAIDISAFGDGEWSFLTATPPDFGNQNPCKKTDMSTLEEGYSSYFKSTLSDNDLADVALSEVSPDQLEGFFEQENNPNPALDQLPVCLEESHSCMGFDTLVST